jgi:hypothetical protein
MFIIVVIVISLFVICFSLIIFQKICPNNDWGSFIRHTINLIDIFVVYVITQA